MPTILVTFQLFVLAASLAIWVVVLRKGVSKREARPENNALGRFGIDWIAEAILPARRRERPFWGIAELLLMYGVMVLVAASLGSVAVSNGWIVKPDPNATVRVTDPILVIVSSIASIVALCSVVAWMHLIDRHACRKISFTTTIADVRLGLIASLMLLPPVLLISTMANYFIPYEHPVLDVLAKIDSPVMIACVLTSTAVIVPLVEEMLFRVLLQGGMQRIADQNSVVQNSTASDERETGLRDQDQEECAAVELASYRPQAYWPLFLVSAIFAASHGGQGAAPIPLFFLAIGLGFLYRQTGRIAAPVIVHMVLNSLTLIQVMSAK